MRSLDRKTEQTQANRTFYGAGLVTSLTGVAAIAAAVESAWFFLLAASLVAGGYFVSIRLRAHGKNLRIVETAVIAICLATYARLFATGETSPLLSPGLAMSHKELALAVMLVWAEVVRSFSLVSDDSLLFTAVPSLALIGVVATTSPGGDTLAYFSIWLCSSITMFIESGKSGQERVLAVRLSRSVFESLLEEAVLTHPEAILYPDADSWRRQLEQARVHVQWDPERDLRGRKLDYRSLQVGISRHLIEDYALRWVLELRDMTPLAHKLKNMLREGKHTQAEKLLPRERLYPLPSAIARRLGAA